RRPRPKAHRMKTPSKDDEQARYQTIAENVRRLDEALTERLQQLHEQADTPARHLADMAMFEVAKLLQMAQRTAPAKAWDYGSLVKSLAFEVFEVQCDVDRKRRDKDDALDTPDT